MYVTSTDQNMAKLAINKSLLKEYDTNEGRTVYMTNGNEFQIQLYNPTQDEIAAGIWINNEKLSNLLVIRPGERIWLERYLDKAKKFKFTTYEVEDNVETENAISHNGEVRVEFYKKTQPLNFTYISQPLEYYTSDVKLNCDTICDTSNHITKGISINCGTLGIETNSLCATADSGLSRGLSKSTKLLNATNSIETGRVSEGSYSSQRFNESYSQFSSWAFKTETIKILPESRKPYTSNDLEKIYCTECGRKLKTKYKFCPFCGNKIDY